MRYHEVVNFHLLNSSRLELLLLPFIKANKKIVTIHDVLPRTKLLKKNVYTLFYKLINRFSHKIVVHSDYAKKLLISIAPFIDESKIVVIPLGCDPYIPYSKSDLRRKYNIDKSLTVFIVAGYIKREKGFNIVIDAFRKLRTDKALLLVVGKIVDHKINGKALENKNIIYKGFVSNKQFEDYLKLSDVYISYRCKSVGESSGPTLMSIGFGKAVIHNNMGFLNETINNFGIIVKNKTDLGKSIHRLVNNQHEQMKLEKKSRLLSVKYSWTNVALKYLSVYKC
jgi:glycosyltransferase involved in cell wall biosynthesis